MLEPTIAMFFLRNCSGIVNFKKIIMKNLFLALFLSIITPLLVRGQYSNYYKADVNVNQNVNVNQKVDISGAVNVNKTVTTIDYGALAQANADRESNRLKSMQIANQQDREAMIAIANKPALAVEYGTTTAFNFPDDLVDRKQRSKLKYRFGYRGFTWSFIVPHKSLFKWVMSDKDGWKFANVSDLGISTSVWLQGQYNVAKRLAYYDTKGETEKEQTNKFLSDIVNTENLTSYVRRQKNNEGSINDGYYYHKVSISRATIHGQEGYKVMSVIEDDFEKAIVQQFLYSDGEIVILATSKVSGDKDVSFEEIEGRNFYLSQTIELMVSVPYCYDLKL